MSYLWLVFGMLGKFLLAETCEKELEALIKTDVVSRVSRYSYEGEGLDYYKDFLECKDNSRIYANINWVKYSSPVVRYGFCLPLDCSFEKGKEALEGLLVKYESSLKIQPFKVSLAFNDFSKTNETPKVAYIFLTCFLILIIFELLGTFSSYFTDNQNFFSSFSIRKNFLELFNQSKQSDNLDVFDGIRSISSIMIIFFHSAYFEFFLALSNRFEFMNSINSLYYCLVISLHHAIDVFFLLSGFLMSFLTMKEMISKGENLA